MIWFLTLNLRETLVMPKGGLFVFEGKIDGQDEMDVLLVPGVHTAAGHVKGEKLIGRQLQLFQQEAPEDGIIIIQRDRKIGESEHIVPFR